MSKPKDLETQIDEFISRFKTLPDGSSNEDRLYSGGWNWDDKWDGQFIETLREFEERTSLRVAQFWRTQKVRFRVNKALSKLDVVFLIDKIVKDEWHEIKFQKNGVVVWFKPHKTSWYR